MLQFPVRSQFMSFLFIIKIDKEESKAEEGIEDEGAFEYDMRTKKWIPTKKKRTNDSNNNNNNNTNTNNTKNNNNNNTLLIVELEESLYHLYGHIQTISKYRVILAEDE